MATEIYIAVTRTDGLLVHVAFQCQGRFAQQPVGGWEISDENLWKKIVRFVTRDPWATWVREPTDANIEYELARHSANWSRQGEGTMIGWRIISEQEHMMFERDRDYRNALEDVGGQIRHNMAKARELHRGCLRHRNGEKLLLLDREWVDCAATGMEVEADAVQGKRQALRDLVNDPRIEAAQSVDELKLIVPTEE